ncbi:DUF975 family protein [Xylocopilactobacillus apis]|uniref:Membrane protein n=1 Tax=Xylocopilactobacillus apis TaxID=2932183 RepID=A0AAU9DCS9_9LACO|nr:DUF975 family protein [Xylocopilactobacillus apis]BDR55951.1 membrane protein [Xylocopilactobacillus apis]
MDNIQLKTRSELKREVKDLYRGKWGTAVKLNLIPVILEILLRIFVLVIFFAMIAIISFTGKSLDLNSAPQMFVNASSFIESYVGFLIGIGIMFSTLDWLRTKEAPNKVLKSVFSVFTRRYFLGTLVIQILTNIFTIVWGLLFIIPGIVKSYSYSQAQFIFKDLVQDHYDKDISYFECISLSKEMMRGNKWRLFVLQLSFLGWDIIEFMTLGIASFWTRPYKNGTYAAFYKDLAEKTDVTFEEE